MVGVVIACALMWAVPRGHVAAQDATGKPGPLTERIESAIATVPFGPGERMDYDVKLGPVSVGDGYLQVAGVGPVRGKRSYHVALGLSGGIPLARVNDRQESWFDVRTLASRRFIQDLHQVRYKSYRHWEIYPEEKRWDREDDEEMNGESVDLPLDEIAFLYYVRTLPLEVGETYTLNNYFRKDRNPVILRVLRRERVEVPAGTYETIVIQPVIPEARGLFSEGGRAEVYFTDDEDRIPVRIESRVPVVGSISLHLKNFTRGRPLRR